MAPEKTFCVFAPARLRQLAEKQLVPAAYQAANLAHIEKTCLV
jgi:hypothetical protein